MVRLIDADKMLLELDCERRDSCEGCRFSPDEDGLCIHDEIEEWVNAQPTVDAVPVVRCKDCTFCEYTPTGYMICGSDFYGLVGDVDPMDYCSRAERRCDNG